MRSVDALSDQHSNDQNDQVAAFLAERVTVRCPIQRGRITPEACRRIQAQVAARWRYSEECPCSNALTNPVGEEELLWATSHKEVARSSSKEVVHICAGLTHGETSPFVPGAERKWRLCAEPGCTERAAQGSTGLCRQHAASLGGARGAARRAQLRRRALSRKEE